LKRGRGAGRREGCGTVAERRDEALDAGAQIGVAGEPFLEAGEGASEGGIVAAEAAGDAADRDPAEPAGEVCGEAASGCGRAASPRPRENGDGETGFFRDELEECFEAQRRERGLGLSNGREAFGREGFVSDDHASCRWQILVSRRGPGSVDELDVTADGAAPRVVQERE
jgi:hypothetical protein